MSNKTEIHENYRVEIYPRGLGSFGYISMSDRIFFASEKDRQGQYRDLCLEIAAQAKRHVDGAGSIDVKFDTRHVCRHCGAEWTEKSDLYNRGCCDKDQAEEDSRISESEK